MVTFSSSVTHHLKYGKLDLEFDSSAAKLVKLVVILAHLISSSVALPAQLISFIFHFGNLRLFLTSRNCHKEVTFFSFLGFAGVEVITNVASC